MFARTLRFFVPKTPGPLPRRVPANAPPAPPQAFPIGVDTPVDGTHGHVLKRVVTAGVGECPPPGAIVTVHYTGTLAGAPPSAEPFDSSRPRGKPFEFIIGAGDVIKGWDVGVATMQPREVAVISCGPSFAYGKQGMLPTIPGDATLNFEIELLEWREGSTRSLNDTSYFMWIGVTSVATLLCAWLLFGGTRRRR